MKRTFFIADTHFGHANIIKFCNRPFQSIEEHDEALIENWNKVVTRNDDVWHLGDFCFGRSDEDFYKVFRRLNGKIHFVKGNHDKLAMKNRNAFASYYSSGITEIEIEGVSVVLCHYPMLSWNKSFHGSFHLFGHVHGWVDRNPQWKRNRALDVGVDVRNFTPIEWDEVVAICEMQEPNNV